MMIEGSRDYTWTSADSGAVAVGVVAGFMSGLFGIGGGIVIVPGLVLVMTMDQRRAHGTSLAAMIPIAVAGVAGFALDAKVDWVVAALLAAGSMVGARVGSDLLHRWSTGRLRLAFAALLLVTAVRLVLEVHDGTGRASLDPAAAVALLVAGLIAGVVSGLLGVGGGVVLVPVQMLLFGIPDAVAKGTSLAVIIPTAIVGTRANLARGNAALRPAVIVGVAGIASAFAASRLAVDLDPIVSSVLFALLLSFVSLRMLLQRDDRIR